jgi:alpha-tubulin suppressor-like RCC1 family protein
MNRAKFQLHFMRSSKIVADNKWKLKSLRDKEAAQLEALNSKVTHLLQSTKQKLNNGAVHKKDNQKSLQLVDIYVSVDNTDIYPSGWTSSFGLLEDELQEKGLSISQVSVGGSHTVFLLSDGKLMSCGWGDRGQTGLGICVNTPTPKGIDLTKNDKTPVFISIDCGKDHTAALSADGSLYMFGCNRHGQVGGGSKVNMFSSPLLLSNYFESFKIAEVSCGSTHTMALTNGGRVYTWGSGSAVGHGVSMGNESVFTPKIVQALQTHRIRKIAAGWEFSACLSIVGDVFTWGEGSHCQLGLGDRKRRVVPTIVQALLPPGGRVRNTPERARNESTFISSITCGGRHALVLTASGDVYAWGSNKHGQLGLGDLSDRSLPVRVSSLKGIAIHRLSAGWCSSIALARTGVLYAWGSGGGLLNRKPVLGGAGASEVERPMQVAWHDLQSYKKLSDVSISFSNTQSIAYVRRSSDSNPKSPSLSFLKSPSVKSASDTATSPSSRGDLYTNAKASMNSSTPTSPLQLIMESDLNLLSVHDLRNMVSDLKDRIMQEKALERDDRTNKSKKKKTLLSEAKVRSELLQRVNKEKEGPTYRRINNKGRGVGAQYLVSGRQRAATSSFGFDINDLFSPTLLVSTSYTFFNEKHADVIDGSPGSTPKGVITATVKKGSFNNNNGTQPISVANGKSNNTGIKAKTSSKSTSKVETTGKSPRFNSSKKVLPSSTISTTSSKFTKVKAKVDTGLRVNTSKDANSSSTRMASSGGKR